jgi:3-dehydroquinate dehydratase type I
MAEGSDKWARVMKQVSEKNPDLVEFRLDRIRDSKTLESIAKKKGTFRTIATDKAKRKPLAQKRLLCAASELGFDYVDVDLADPLGMIQELKSSNTQIIISHHDPSGTPDLRTLNAVLKQAQRSGADVCKIVTTAKHPRDNLIVLNFVERNAQTTRLVSFAMGKLGIPSRVLSPFFGAEFTFASLGESNQTAPGQLSIDKMRQAWQMLGT